MLSSPHKLRPDRGTNIGEFFASGPPNTAPELPETPWYCRGTAGVLPAFKIVENH